MMFWIAKTIAGFFGLDVSKVQRIVWIVVLVLVGVLVLVSVLWLKSCFDRPPKLDQKEIIEAQQAIAEKDEKKMRDILTNSDVKEATADNTIDNAKANTVNAIHESKAKWANANVEDMAAELERRAKQ